MSEWITIWLFGLGTAIVYVTLIWIASVIKRDVSIIDIFWGSGFALLAWVYSFLDDGSGPRQILALVLVTLWGLRLSFHILWRSQGKEEDYRYREMRERRGPNFKWVSLFMVFWLQGVLMWLISAPLLLAVRAGQPSALTSMDYLATAMFIVGFSFEAVGDLQLARFRDDPSNKGQVMRSGLWRYTRHPNYFGDAVVWWSFFLLALATPSSTWTLFSPILMTLLLLKISGVSLLEKKLSKTRPGYADYVARTNAFVPWLPRSD